MFFKEVDLTDRKAMIFFLANHFRYYTINPWNRLTSYANNVKLQNLEIPNHLQEKAYDFISCDDTGDYYAAVNELVLEFRNKTGYAACFNGRSGGYLVLYEASENDVLMHSIDRAICFDDWSTEDLAERTKLVSSFDKLCDAIRDLFLFYIEHSTIKDVTIHVPKRVRIAEVSLSNC